MQKVSILMAVYNGEKFIEEAIESVINQTYSNIELIICDDGSNDLTPEILSRYESRNKIKVIYEKHRGKVAAFNSAFFNADKESSVCLFAHDDVLLPDSIQKRVQALQNGAKVAYQNSYICDENLKIKNTQYP